MRKKITALLLILAVILTLMPMTGMKAHAEGTWSNLHWEDTTACWDAYPDATNYWVYLYRNGVNESGSGYGSFGATCIDFTDEMEKYGSGNYTFRISPYIDGAWRDDQQSYVSAEMNYTAPDIEIPAPSNPVWDGYIARWDASEYATDYQIDILKRTTGVVFTTVSTSGLTCFDASSVMKEHEAGYYSFRVKAYKGTIASAYSSESAETEYTPAPAPTLWTNLRWDGNVARWDAYPDATNYWVYLYRNGKNETGGGYGSSGATCIDFTDQMGKYGSGNYTFRISPYIDGAWDDDHMSYVSAEMNYTAPDREIPAPSNPVWDGCTARWDEVDNAYDYLVNLYKDGALIEEEIGTYGVNSFNLRSYMEKAGSGVYTFKVCAFAYGKTGPLSAASGETEYTMIPAVTGIKWNNCSAYWNPVDGAYIYWVNVYYNGSRIDSFGVSRTSYPFIDYIELYGSGTYQIELFAYIDSVYAETGSRSDLLYVSDSGSWNKNSKGWWYERADKTYPANCWEMINGKWYHFDASGYMQTGWVKIDNKWFHFDTSGAMQIEWQKIDGKWYFFDSDGVMFTGLKTIDGVKYYFETSGAMKTGWAKIDNKWYYFGASGAMLKNWQKIDGKWYYLGTKGIMQTGWQAIDGEQYYFNASGAMQTGWVKIDNEWYYFETNGAMQKAQWIGDYYVDCDGKMVKSAYIYNGSKYYWVNKDGKYTRAYPEEATVGYTIYIQDTGELK